MATVQQSWLEWPRLHRTQLFCISTKNTSAFMTPFH